ncbi:MlaD family protein [Mycobacterium sp. Marseille-P9652]|uniref:MlaD family protein n=1 Tax=Mycobacterium sp. Marseille-P9652 TaxID=2654950 RepID=UPI0012E7360B|nr:MlaD family protein [Mycobacterium sp. Marseille-P9652]
MTSRAALLRLAVGAGLTVVLLILLLSGVSRPIAAQTRDYTARFTDASGLYQGADVRVRGVLVGRVLATRLERRQRQSVASVRFSLDTKYGILPDTRVAIKYQTLTGTRYLDIVKPSDHYQPSDLVTDVPVAMTMPSFDITMLFNGLQPVFATLSPSELNTFAANAANVLSGDGSGLAPLLDSIHKLTQFVADRQQVVSTLMRNLAEVADTMAGHGKDLIQVVDWVNRPLDSALTVLDELRKSQLYGPDFVAPVIRLLSNLGLKPGIDVDAALDTAFNNVDRTVDAFKFVPVMWENILPPPAAGQPEPCARGRAQLPATMDVLLNGQRVILCNR